MLVLLFNVQTQLIINENKEIDSRNYHQNNFEEKSSSQSEGLKDF